MVLNQEKERKESKERKERTGYVQVLKPLNNHTWDCDCAGLTLFRPLSLVNPSNPSMAPPTPA